MLSLQSELQHYVGKGLHCYLSSSIHFNRIKINDALTSHGIEILGDERKGWISKPQCVRFKIWWEDLLLKLSLPLIGFTNQWARIDWNEKLCLKLVNLYFIFYFRLLKDREVLISSWDNTTYEPLNLHSGSLPKVISKAHLNFLWNLIINLEFVFWNNTLEF